MDLKNDVIEIPYSIRILFLPIYLGVLLTLLSNQFFKANSVQTLGHMSIPRIWLIILFGILFCFVLYVIISAVMKLITRKPGLIINNEEVIDKSSILGARILWDDISDIEDVSVGRMTYILVFVNNPEIYISQTSNLYKKSVMKFRYMRKGTPFFLNKNHLNYSQGKRGLTGILHEILEQKKAARFGV